MGDPLSTGCSVSTPKWHWTSPREDQETETASKASLCLSTWRHAAGTGRSLADSIGAALSGLSFRPAPLHAPRPPRTRSANLVTVWGHIVGQIPKSPCNPCSITNGNGEGGIRTLETVARLHAFQACAFDHSATSPYGARKRAQLKRSDLALQADIPRGASERLAVRRNTRESLRRRHLNVMAQSLM
jgi:hypothetical protein